MEDTSYISLKRSLASIPVKVLNYSGRLVLANHLDAKFVLPSKSGHARDYRGLAELMGFEYKEIKLFEQHEDPTMKILKSWEVLSHATLDKLINYLEEMERYDVISELIPLIAKKISLRKLEDKSSEYTCKSDIKKLDDIAPWSEYAKNVQLYNCEPVRSRRPHLNKKLSIYVGDITQLEIDAIVNTISQERYLRGIGGVDGAIHDAAGPKFSEECLACDDCMPGDAMITGGYNLPAKYVIHTVGPYGENKRLLTSCYRKCLRLARKKNLRTIAFPCISTGSRLYPNFKAAPVAIKTVREFLERYESSPNADLKMCSQRVSF